MASRQRAALERVARLKYWRAEDARVVVEGWRESGESVTSYARRYGLHARRVSRWARELEEGAGQGPVRFHPVRLVRSEERGREPGGKAPIEIVLGAGHLVRVPPGFVAEDLERVLEVLASGAGC
jgi:transposase-like protein